MKKFIISVLVITVILFSVTPIIAKYANDDLYNLLYPCEKISYETGALHQTVLKKGDYFFLGNYNGENIVWKYLSNNTAQCDKIIEFRKYDGKSSNWETSDLRDWLNSENGFYGSSTLSEFDIIDGEVFLLSKNELKKLSAGERAKQPTRVAIKISGAKTLFLRKYCWYWTNSPIETNSLSVATVTQSGEFYKTPSNDVLTGVCPAINLKSNIVNVCGGDGTKNKPYILVY